MANRLIVSVECTFAARLAEFFLVQDVQGLPRAQCNLHRASVETSADEMG
jgi:hypothetical protein